MRSLWIAAAATLVALALPPLGVTAQTDPISLFDEVPQAAIDDLAPTGVLRFALGLGNAVIATRDPDTGEVRGLAMDLLPELAARLGVPFATFEYVQAAEAIQAIEDGVWDVGFVPVGSPLPADEEWLSKLDVTPPLLEFENTYLVPAASPIATHADADQTGQRIVVVAGTSTEGFLSRMLEHAELITVPGRPAEPLQGHEKIGLRAISRRHLPQRTLLNLSPIRFH